MRSSIFALGLTSSLLVSAAAGAQSSATEEARKLYAGRERVAKATVTLPEKSCAGSVAGDREHVVTAAHCVIDGAQRVRVRLSNGVTLGSDVQHIDRDADVALLRLDAPANVEPLGLGDYLPRRGARLLFVGRLDRPSKTQVVSVDRLGRCPSLPGQPQAMFTSVQAQPGDSGAPLVDAELRVVGVIHGGASCHIAAPTRALAREISSQGAQPAPDVSPPNVAPPAPAQPEREPDADGWFFERTPNGFRFRWNFRWSFGR